MKSNEKKVLFLPFLQIPSGHHQVSNNLMEIIQKLNSQVMCEKIDILSYSYGRVEKLISFIYLKWIRVFPQIYNLIYRNSVYKNIKKEKRYILYEVLFLHFMKKLLLEKNPDFIICTHSLPAYMCNYLKKKGELQVPVINVYTDYFIHQFWGIKHIDLHFVPTIRMKTFLLEKGISEDQIFVMGIPVHREIKRRPERRIKPLHKPLTLLVAGGNLGVGALNNVIDEFIRADIGKLYVLCGKNQRLYERLKSLNHEHIIPYSYINCMSEMNALYDEVDAIITKPGGVTVSECLYKKIPIFIYDTLPGQEKINLHELKTQGLIFHLERENIRGQIFSILSEKNVMERYKKQLETYHSYLSEKGPADVLEELLLDSI